MSAEDRAVRPITTQVRALRKAQAAAKTHDPRTLWARAVWEPLRMHREAMTQPERVVVRASPQQCDAICYSGPLDPWLDRLVEWRACDNLSIELAHSTSRIAPAQYDEMRRGLRRLGDRTRWHRGDFGLWFFALNLELAERGLMAIRSAEGLYCQLFRQGWPITPPFIADSAPGVGLVVMTTFQPDSYPGIPFTANALEAALYDEARELTTFEWSDLDEPPWSCYEHAWKLEVEPERHTGTPLTPDGRIWSHWPEDAAAGQCPLRHTPARDISSPT